MTSWQSYRAEDRPCDSSQTSWCNEITALVSERKEGRTQSNRQAVVMSQLNNIIKHRVDELYSYWVFCTSLKSLCPLQARLMWCDPSPQEMFMYIMYGKPNIATSIQQSPLNTADHWMSPTIWTFQGVYGLRAYNRPDLIIPQTRDLGGTWPHAHTCPWLDCLPAECYWACSVQVLGEINFFASP